MGACHAKCLLPECIPMLFLMRINSTDLSMKLYLLPFILLAFCPLSAQTLRHAELLGRPTNNSVTVQVFFDQNVDMCVQYGTVSGNYPNQTAWQTFAAGEPAEMALTGLQPNTRYYYRVCYRQPNTTAVKTRPEYTFQTQRPAGSTFTFVIQADPHVDEQSDTALYRLCLRNQLADRPDFVVDLGDILMSDKLKNAAGRITQDTVIARAKLMRNFYETMCHSVPLFITLGNHEGEAGWQLNNTAENVAVWGTVQRKKYFPNPFPDAFYTGDRTNHAFVGLRENYYAWTWGDALFIVLDPYWYTTPKPDANNGWRWTLGKAQYDWLKATLEANPTKFKFVFAHQLVGGDPDGRGGVEFANRYEWGGQNLDGTPGFAANRPGWYKPIKDLLKEHRVNIFFHGHDHFFGKQEKDCLIYQETPQPSHPNFQSANYARDYGYLEGQILPNSGHLRVTVSPEGVKVDYVRAYLPKNETNTRKNRDVGATYFVGLKNCYDSLATSSIPVLWNSHYADELVSPNPFQDQTKIAFSLPEAEHMSVHIFNEQGQCVRTLLQNTLVPAGEFQTYWDGRDAQSVPMPTGVYWYRLQGEKGGVGTGKMILVR